MDPENKPNNTQTMDNTLFSQLTISEIGRALGGQNDTDFILIRSEELTIHPDFFDHPTRFAGGAFALCLEGEAEVTANLNRYTFRKNQLLILPTNSIIQFHSRSDDFKSYMAGFSPTLLEGLDLRSVIPLMTEILDSPLLELDDEDTANFIRSCSLIEEKSKQTEHPHRREIMKHQIFSAFYEISYIFQKQRSVEKRTRTHNEEIVYEFSRLVREHYREERNVDFYADKLCLTPKYLSTLVKKTSGHSVPEWIRFALMMDAKVQLKYTTNTVQQIADNLNFPNPSFFGRFFKKHTGMTPLEYRIN